MIPNFRLFSDVLPGDLFKVHFNIFTNEVKLYGVLLSVDAVCKGTVFKARKVHTIHSCVYGLHTHMCTCV